MGEGSARCPGGGGREVRGAQCSSSRSQVGYERPGRRKLWEGVDASREFWRDAGGRFLERGATLVAVSPSASCTEPCLLVTPGYGSGPWVEGKRERAASRQKRLEAPGAQRWPAGVGRAGRTGRRRAGSARARRLGLARPTGVPARERVPSWEWWAEGRCPGTGRGFRDRPLCGFSCAGATPRPGPRAEPVRSRDERHPEKSCAEKVPEDRRARAPRVREGSFVEGPLREAVPGEPSSQDPQRRRRWQVSRGELAAVGQRAGDRGETLPLATLRAAPADGLAGSRESLCPSLPAQCWDPQFLARIPSLSARPQLHSFLGERARCQSAMGMRASLWAPASPPYPPPPFFFLATLRFCGGTPLPSACPPGPGNRKLETASPWPPYIPDPATDGPTGRTANTRHLPPGSAHLPLTPPAPL